MSNTPPTNPHPLLSLLAHSLLHDLLILPEADAFRSLRRMRKDWRTDLREELGVPSPPKGRPRGRSSLAPVPALFIALAIDECGMTPAAVLRLLGKNADSGSSDYRWLRYRLKRGRELRQGAYSDLSYGPEDVKALLRYAVRSGKKL